MKQKLQQDTAMVNVAKRDKMNNVDYHWFIVRTLPHQERKVAAMLERHMPETENILEVYCPTHTTVSVTKNGTDVKTPLFAGYVFVLATQRALTDFIDRHYPEGTVLYERKKEKDRKAGLWTIPEKQMKAFKDFNENYADKVIILERPYTDYAFNPKTNEPNDIVKVIDGPLKGKEGYIAKFRKDKRLVFHMRGLGNGRDMAVSIPNIWNFHVVRLHNAENDRQTTGTVKQRAVDMLVGMIQGCGYGDKTLPMLYEFVEELTFKPSLVDFCKNLYKKGHTELSQRFAGLDTNNAELLLNLIRYERDNPGYVKSNWNRLIIRPFLTPTPGMDFSDGQKETRLQHAYFTEIIRKVEITEQAYYPSKEEEATITTTYYAHIGIQQNKDDDGFTLFANWDAFLGEYFMTGGKANEKLVKGTTQPGNRDNKEKQIESFRNYSPTLYNILTDESSKVKAVQDFKVGEDRLNVMAINATTNIETAKDFLITTCTDICKEINTTTHLAVWRRYLRTVWLHR